MDFPFFPVFFYLKTSLHYSKSQIFVQKFNFDKTPTFSRVFHPEFFLPIFLVKSKLSTAKKSKTTTFSRVFHPKKIDNFLGKSKLNFWTKNEDFEQCGKIRSGKNYLKCLLKCSTILTLFENHQKCLI